MNTDLGLTPFDFPPCYKLALNRKWKKKNLQIQCNQNKHGMCGACQFKQINLGVIAVL